MRGSNIKHTIVVAVAYRRADTVPDAKAKLYKFLSDFRSCNKLNLRYKWDLILALFLNQFLSQ